MQNFSVIIPCYNEDQSIAKTIQLIRQELASSNTYELIVVDDGSSDQTHSELIRIFSKDSDLKVLRHEVNKGYGAAIKTGILAAGTDTIVIIDADGTYPIDRIQDLVNRSQYVDMVVGSRVGSNPLIRRIPKFLIRTYLSWLIQQEVPDMNSGLRVFKASQAKRLFKLLPNRFSFTTTITLLLLANNRKVRFVPIDYKSRVGQSKFRVVKDTLLMISSIINTGFLYRPTRVIFSLTLSFLILNLICLSLAWYIPITFTATIIICTISNVFFAALIAFSISRSPHLRSRLRRVFLT
jgi:glycosyltransferase involved in cell wall biosynthesis